MFKALFGRKSDFANAQSLYGAVVARARQPHFYDKMGVPDTFDGRFEMMTLHLYLLVHRLRDETPDKRRLSQQVFDLFIEDMDRGLREAGVGDQTVPKRIKKMTRVFYGRAGAYDEVLALDGDQQTAMEDVMQRNLFPEQDEPGGYRDLAEYALREAEILAAIPVDDMIKHGLLFADPFPKM